MLKQDLSFEKTERKSNKNIDIPKLSPYFSLHDFLTAIIIDISLNGRNNYHDSLSSMKIKPPNNLKPVYKDKSDINDKLFLNNTKNTRESSKESSNVLFNTIFIKILHTIKAIYQKPPLTAIKMLPSVNLHTVKNFNNITKQYNVIERQQSNLSNLYNL